MTTIEPIVRAIPPTGRGTELAAPASAPTLDWSEAEQGLNTDTFCWLATVRPGGAPHVVPVFAVWSGSSVFVSSKDSSRKSRNLAADGRCVVTTQAAGAHLVVEGTATRVSDRDTLQHASEVFETVYGWPTTVTGDAIDAPYSAPTSGGPPFGIHEITPTTAFAFPAEGNFMPTRWQFPTG
ncbi:hypothetical protein BJF85_01985 [Saccharomonospora sp. CUA-673]|uniref:pyridoxamine 5'-phosphate oxidase family protein n=1 Tax=Saccharomonospora sp. CUA-673 TaxID=1904969 RepID=UPI000961E8FC|nr:pyridoxamine 5'-phosphate oxidase family protein [Saccharomonospora sp. CUA-673]OLT45189.1 hypothetical protein BJF85_01985 [Saccharomonospora sp. CUA-673]